MFVKSVVLKTNKEQEVRVGDILNIELESKASTHLEVRAINDGLYTLEEVSTKGSIFIYNYKESDIRSILVNKPQKVVKVSIVDKVTRKLKPLKGMKYSVEESKVSESEVKVGDKFYYNNSQECEVAYLSKDKSLMVARFVNSGKEVALLHTDVMWLRNTKIKGRV